jgi:hypothetical protein
VRHLSPPLRAVAVTRPLTGAACDLIGRHLQSRPDALRAIVTTITTDADSEVGG